VICDTIDLHWFRRDTQLGKFARIVEQRQHTISYQVRGREIACDEQQLAGPTDCHDARV
jgi:hypothetical protein